MITTGTLTFFCGKMGAGKSTYAVRTAHEQNAVLLSEDEWLSALYPGQITSFDDYIRCAGLLRPLVRTHVQNILRIGTPVVMDFPANTVRQREWFKSLVAEIQAPHELVFLDASDELCLRRIAHRRTDLPEREAFDTPEVFHQVTRYFEAPGEEEGLRVLRIEVWE